MRIPTRSLTEVSGLLPRASGNCGGTGCMRNTRAHRRPNDKHIIYVKYLTTQGRSHQLLGVLCSMLTTWLYSKGHNTAAEVFNEKDYRWRSTIYSAAKTTYFIPVWNCMFRLCSNEGETKYRHSSIIRVARILLRLSKSNQWTLLHPGSRYLLLVHTFLLSFLLSRPAWESLSTIDRLCRDSRPLTSTASDIIRYIEKWIALTW